MSKNTKSFMRKFTRRLRRALELEGTHCGHDELVVLADLERVELMKFVEDEVERLGRKAGEV